ncbi:MAG: DNA polymerase III subunit beta [Deltaproteobacteria bacterium RBG_13_43_22]|jgi:predicted nucleotidyltransferase|nr:MAG: DNA polymerase III subunit beta [Deltaproteobacteria bacterium RBG_13_43_22]
MILDQTRINRMVELAKNFGATRLILFGSQTEIPQEARDVDLACDGIPGWKLFEFAARIEEELEIPLDIVPLTPPSRFTRSIEKKGQVLL